MASHLVVALLLLTTADPPGAQAAALDEEHAWKNVHDAFHKKEWVLTVVESEAFARRFPKSARAAQAIYQAGCSYLMMQKPNEANAAFQRLAAEHMDSPWAILALQLNLDANTLLALADTMRSQGRTKKTPALTERAGHLYSLFAQRYPNDQRAKGEVVYKHADCAQRFGKHAQALAALRSLAQSDQADWNKLAAFRLGDRAKFQSGMSDLLDLSANGEERSLFVELADRFQSELSQDARHQCAYLRCHCVDGAERFALLRRFCKEHFDSPWANEAAFFLAECAFENGKHAEAQEVYRALAARHPDGLRARRLAAWADWIDQQASDQQELGRLFVECLKKFDRQKGGIAVTLHVESDALPFPIDGRIAYCDRQVLMRAALGNVGFACGLQRPNLSWYRFLNQETMQRVEKSALPLLELKVNEFPKGSLSFQWGIAMNPDPAAVSSIEIDPAAGALLAAKFIAGNHFHRRLRADGGCDFIFEWPHRNPRVEQTLTVQFSEQGRPEQLTYRSTSSAGKNLRIVAKDLVFGQPIATEHFAMPREPGVAVRNLEQVNPWEVFAQIMNLCGPAYQTLLKELPKTR